MLIERANAQTLRDHRNTPADQLLALNPNLLLAIGYGLNDAGQGRGWLHIAQPDDSFGVELMKPAMLAQHLLHILSDNRIKRMAVLQRNSTINDEHWRGAA